MFRGDKTKMRRVVLVSFELVSFDLFHVLVFHLIACSLALGFGHGLGFGPGHSWCAIMDMFVTNID